MNWNTLRYKQKVRILGSGAIILLIVCYLYGFKQTLAIYNKYEESKIKAEKSTDYANLFPLLQYEEKRLNTFIKNNLVDSTTTSKETLAFIGSYCKAHNLQVIEYLPAQVTENKVFNIVTSQVTVGGSYKELVQLVYELENHQHFGRLCSLSFKSTEDPYNGNISLTATFYLQNLIQN